MIDERKSANQPGRSVREELDIIDVAMFLNANKKFIIATTFVTTLFVGVFSLLTPNKFTATVTLISLDKGNSSDISSLLSASSGNLGFLASQAGLVAGGSDKLLVLLNSRTLKESVINELDLLPILFEEKWDKSKNTWKSSKISVLNKRDNNPSLQDGTDALKNKLFVGKDKETGVITLSYTSNNPEVAATVANQFTIELEKYTKQNTLSNAKKNRIFIEDQLKLTKNELELHEIELQRFQKKNKIVSIDAQAQASVQAYADIKAKIITSQVESSILQRSTFEGDPRIALKQQEIIALEQQLKKLETSSVSSPTISFEKAPSLGLELARIKRELLIKEKVFELLTQQHEMAKIRESQDDISFQVIDNAIPPEKKSGPRRTINVLLAIISSSILAISICALRKFISASKQAMIDRIGKDDN